MRVLVDINHPAHVHFFRNFITGMRERGHEVLIAASEKDIATQLLREYGFDFLHVGSYGKSIIRKILNVPVMALRMFRLVKKYQPDVLVGLASSRITHAAFLSGKTAYVFTDTEHASEQILLFRPFAQKIITPDVFTRKLGRKHLTYPGFHELAYLHPDQYQPDPGSLTEAGLSPDSTFFILRFVSWEASHDIGKRSMSPEQRLQLIDHLSKMGRVIISSEAPLPPELLPYAMNIPSAKMHDLLHYATIYIGEGGTMAIEAALLGTPSILVNPLKAGVFDELKKRYRLLEQVSDYEEMTVKINSLLSNKHLKAQWLEKKERLLGEKIDVTAWMINFVENSEKR